LIRVRTVSSAPLDFTEGHRIERAFIRNSWCRIDEATGESAVTDNGTPRSTQGSVEYLATLPDR
jgi:hypothetical protein